MSLDVDANHTKHKTQNTNTTHKIHKAHKSSKHKHYKDSPVNHGNRVKALLLDSVCV